MMNMDDGGPARGPAKPGGAAVTAFAALVLWAAGSMAADVEPRHGNAGVTRMTVQDAEAFDVLVAYPTASPEVPFQVGPFTVAGSRDAAIDKGGPFPIVLFSHGNGRRGGAPLIHQRLITSLARKGYLVIAPFHPGTPAPLVARPRQIHKALDAVLADRRFSAHADRTRMAMMGFSFGGAVALVVAGAQPDLAHLAAYCRNRTDDPRACQGAPADAPSTEGISRPSADPLPLKALVLMEPFGAVFAADGLKQVLMPTLLYRAAHSDLNREGNIAALAQGLPNPPRQAALPGGHFVFADPCPALLVSEAPEVCQDAPGIDRAALHQRLEADIAAFLQQNLN